MANSQSLLLSLLVGCGVLLSLSSPARAQILAPEFSCQSGAEITQIPEQDIVTPQSASEAGITVPSLWWAQQQFDPFDGKLISTWRAYQDLQQVDLIVNRQLWALMDYIERYSFVYHLGTVARDYNYDLKVFNQRQECLAVYTCDYSVTPAACKIAIDTSVQGTLLR